jgi:molybdate transport system permease protein
MTWRPLLLSLEVAALATLLTLVAGTALALLLRWEKVPARHFIDAIISTPLVLPPTVLGYYLLVVLGRDSALGRAWEAVTGHQLVFSFAAAVIAAAVGSIPLVVRSTKVGLDAVDPSLVAAARTLGARPTRVLFTVVLPLAGPGIIAGAMMGFARALGDYGATAMFAGARIEGTPTASIYVMEELYNLHDDNVAATALAMTVVGVLMLYLANRLTKRLHPWPTR